MCSLLSFYSEGQKRSYLFNLKQNKKNQFFFWPQLEKGSSGYFVISDSGSLENSEALKEKYLKVLKPYFEIVEKADFYPLFSSKDIPLKWALVFKVKEYTGLKPIETFEY
jgi:hypothetical protein